MKLVKWSVLSAIALLISGNVLAADLKIGVVNIVKVMDEAPQAASARKAMQDEFAPRERDLIKLQQDIKKSEETLNRNGSVMSESQRSKLERDIVSKKRDFQRDQDAFREDVNFKRNELLEKLQRDMVGIIQDWGKQQKFDILLAEGVVYMSPAVDVTDKVLVELKNRAK